MTPCIKSFLAIALLALMAATSVEAQAQSATKPTAFVYAVLYL